MILLRKSGPDSSTVGGESCWKKTPGFSGKQVKDPVGMNLVEKTMC